MDRFDVETIKIQYRGNYERLRGIEKMSAERPFYDPVNPSHYIKHPSGVECIQITRHMGFNLGNVLKYIWRADLKGNALEDLKKARWYLDDEIKRREAGKPSDG